MLLFTGCNGGEAAGTLDDIQVIGVDFELNSVILTNNGTADVRTEGLWMYQDGQSSEFNIFTIEPRASILFSVRELGQVVPSGGEFALFKVDSFSDPEAMIDYVAWGTSGHSRIDIATQAELWGSGESVETEDDTLILTRTDPSFIGATAWAARSEIGG